MTRPPLPQTGPTRFAAGFLSAIRNYADTTMPPNAGQFTLVILAILLFAVGGVLSIARLRLQRPLANQWTKALLIAGILANVAVLSCHAPTRGSWLPLEDSFDSLVWLATLLPLFTL